MSDTITREQLEKALWEWSGFHADSASVAGYMIAVDAYAAGISRELSTSPPLVVAAYLHTLTTLAEQLLDTGGRVKLVQEEAPVLGLVPETREEEPADDDTITCRICGVAKAPEEFHRDNSRRTGRKSRCRACLSKSSAA